MNRLKRVRSNDLMNRLGAFDPDQLAVQAAVEVAQFVGVQTQLL